MNKVCTTCNQEKSIEDFHKRKDLKSGYSGQCKSCRNLKIKQYRSSDGRHKKWNLSYRVRNKEKINQKNAERRLTLRRQVFDLFGNSCNACGFTDERALQIDHIKGDGFLERKINGYGESFLKKLLCLDANLLLETYQLLCANCNWIKRVENSEYGKSKKSRWQPKVNS